MSENALANKMYKGNKLHGELPFAVIKGEIVTCILHAQTKET